VTGLVVELFELETTQHRIMQNIHTRKHNGLKLTTDKHKAGSSYFLPAISKKGKYLNGYARRLADYMDGRQNFSVTPIVNGLPKMVRLPMVLN